MALKTMNYPIPDNESQRLQELARYGLDDNQPDFELDEIAEFAAQLCGCPIGIINIIAEQWETYKGKHGVPPEISGGPRGGVCSTTVCRTDMLVVPDLTKDDRFAHLPHVTGPPHYRFYAGMPLINSEGYALGAFCIIDFEPKDLEPKQKEAIRKLTRQAVTQLELRRKLAELENVQSALSEEKQRADELLLNILPAHISDELKTQGRVTPRYYDSATILFSDFKGFTGLAERNEPRALIDELDRHFSAFDDIIERHGLEKLKTIGDAYMCAGGIPEKNHTHPVNACTAALEMQTYMTRANLKREQMGLAPWELRIGIHTGGVMAGVVGKRKFTYDIWGDAVNTASIMETLGEPGRITVSESTYSHIGDHFDVEYQGEFTAKEKDNLKTYFLMAHKNA